MRVFTCIPTPLTNANLYVNPATIGYNSSLVVRISDLAYELSNGGGIQIQCPSQYSISLTNLYTESGLTNAQLTKQTANNMLIITGDFDVAQTISFYIIGFTNPKHNKTDQFILETFILTASSEKEVKQQLAKPCQLTPRPLTSRRHYSFRPCLGSDPLPSAQDQLN